MAEKISYPSKHMIKTGEPNNQDHRGFQLGQNPMAMTAFEKALAAKEKYEREEAHYKYVMGIQGRDGGECVGGEHSYS